MLIKDIIPQDKEYICPSLRIVRVIRLLFGARVSGCGSHRNCSLCRVSDYAKVYSKDRYEKSN